MTRFPRRLDTVTARTAAWAAVEDAQHRLNLAAEKSDRCVKQVEVFHAARIQYEAEPRTSEASAKAWRVTAEKQTDLNLIAVDALPSEWAALNAALQQYVKLGGSPDRLPGVGGLS